MKIMQPLFPVFSTQRDGNPSNLGSNLELPFYPARRHSCDPRVVAPAVAGPPNFGNGSACDAGHLNLPPSTGRQEAQGQAACFSFLA